MQEHSVGLHFICVPNAGTRYISLTVRSVHFLKENEEKDVFSKRVDSTVQKGRDFVFKIGAEFNLCLVGHL